MAYAKGKIKVATPAMTEEEKQAKEQENINRFLLKEQRDFALNILDNLCHGKGNVTEAEGLAMVDRAVSMAEHLCKKLYAEE